MKKLKTIGISVLIAVLAFSVAACGAQKDDGSRQKSGDYVDIYNLSFDLEKYGLYDFDFYSTRNLTQIAQMLDDGLSNVLSSPISEEPETTVTFCVGQNIMRAWDVYFVRIIMYGSKLDASKYLPETYDKNTANVFIDNNLLVQITKPELVDLFIYHREVNLYEVSKILIKHMSYSSNLNRLIDEIRTQYEIYDGFTLYTGKHDFNTTGLDENTVKYDLTFDLQTDSQQHIPVNIFEFYNPQSTDEYVELVKTGNGILYQVKDSMVIVVGTPNASSASPAFSNEEVANYNALIDLIFSKI